MSYSDFLASLLAKGPYDPDQRTIGSFLRAMGSLLDTDRANGLKLINNLSPYTADIDGIAAWEHTLNLPTDTSKNLDRRRQICIAKSYRLPGILTFTKLVQILNVFSPSYSAKVIEDPAAYTVYGKFPIHKIGDYQEILRMTYAYLPAHLKFIIGFFINIQKTLNFSRHMKIDFFRKISEPTSIIAKKKIKIVKTLSNRYLTVKGMPLDGGREMDGSWALSAELVPQPIEYLISIGINCKPIILGTPNITTQQMIVVQRTASENPKRIVLNGSYNLDASLNLGGLGSLVVKINGVEV